MYKKMDAISVTRFNLETGEITSVRTGCYGNIKEEGYSFVIGVGDPKTQYVDTTQIPFEFLQRPAMEINQSAAKICPGINNTMVLSGLPVPCRAQIGNRSYEITDGLLEWSSTLAGVYNIRLSSFPYLDWIGSVEVTP